MGYSDGSQAIRAWLKLRDVGTVRTLLIEKKLPPSPAQKKKGFRGSRGHGGWNADTPPISPVLATPLFSVQQQLPDLLITESRVI